MTLDPKYLQGQLERLVRLRAKNLLSDEEMNALKDELVSSEVIGSQEWQSLVAQSSVPVQALLRGESVSSALLLEPVSGGPVGNEDIPPPLVEADVPPPLVEEDVPPPIAADPVVAERDFSEGSSSWPMWMFGGALFVLLCVFVWSVLGMNQPGSLSADRLPVSSVAAPTPEKAESPERSDVSEGPHASAMIFWEGHGLHPVLGAMLHTLGKEDFGAVFSGDLAGIARTLKVSSLPGTDLQPWRETLELEVLIGGLKEPATLRIVGIRSGFSEIGPSGVFVLELEHAGLARVLSSLSSRLGEGASGSEWGSKFTRWETADGFVWKVYGASQGRLVLYRKVPWDREEELSRRLAVPMATYEKAKRFLFGRDSNLQAVESLSRQALAEFAAVHPRVLHGHTLVNMCHADYRLGKVDEARFRCRMATERSLESDVRAEAGLFLARMAMWDERVDEAIGLLQQARDLANRSSLKQSIHLHLTALTERPLSKDTCRKLLRYVGCEEGRALGMTWRRLPEELGLGSTDELVTLCEVVHALDSVTMVERARLKCGSSRE